MPLYPHASLSSDRGAERSSHPSQIGPLRAHHSYISPHDPNIYDAVAQHQPYHPSYPFEQLQHAQQDLYPEDWHHQYQHNTGPMPPELESDLQDFWKRDTQPPPELHYDSRHQNWHDHAGPSNYAYQQGPDLIEQPQMNDPTPLYYPYDEQYATMGPYHQPSYHEPNPFNLPSTPRSQMFDRNRHTPTPSPLILPSVPAGPSSISGWSASHRHSLQPVLEQQEQELEEYGTTTDEWKHLWSSRKPYR